MAALDVRVPDVGKARVPIHRQGDDGGIVAGGGAAQRGVAIAVKPEIGGAEVHFSGVVVPEPLGGEQTGGGVDGLVLHFRVEGGVSLRQPHEPQIVVAEFFRPKDFGACQHFLAVLEIEGVGGFFPVGVGEIRGEALPVRPQGGGRVGQNGPVFPALEAGVFQQARQKGIVVQDGADDEDVRVAVAGLADCLPEPVGGLLPLLRRADALVVFDVVAEDEIRAALVVAPSPQLLAAAYGVDPTAVGEQDGAGLPRFARLLAEVR